MRNQNGNRNARFFSFRHPPSAIRHPGNGFTLVELMVVLAIIALLVSIVAPRYIGRVAKAEEAVLKQDLVLMRDALDKHYADAGRYPDALDELVKKRYLRRIPDDPITRSSGTWIVVAPDDPEKGGVYDVRSGAPGSGSNGTPYAEW
jgi:general secretion pathway protein G